MVRVKEPLNGFRKAQGHIIFHITLLVVSYYVLRINHSSDEKNCKPESKEESPENVEFIINCIRAMHAILISSHCFGQYIESMDNDLIVKLLRVVEIFAYIGTILYQQYFVLKYPPKQCEDLFVFLSKSWMMMELFIFYSLQINAGMFLAYIQMRGTLGYKKNHENRNRFKFDALDYYEIDIEWCSFQFVPIGLSITGMLVTAKIGRNME